MLTVQVPLQPGYDVLIAEGSLSQFGALLIQRARPNKALIVTDSTVFAHGYPGIVKNSLEMEGISCKLFQFPAGETSKNLETFGEILSVAAEFGLSGGDLFVAVGGGVTGDLTGFAAASYRRGTAFAQVPTTLLAAVDSSVGGKTGVNLPQGKNLVGAFWQPNFVLCDPTLLATLTEEQYACGLAECLKYGVLWDPELFSSFKTGALFRVTPEQISRCVSMKRDVVLLDEHDASARRLLNLGHTLGHTIEQASGFSISHGAAIGLGMLLISRTFCPEILSDLTCALKENSLPTHCDFPIKSLFQALSQDKKRSGDDITVVIPEKIGKCVLRTMRLWELEQALLDSCI